MPGWRVERTPRAASGSVLSAPGGSPLMPPQSQGAERRTERRAGRAGSRWVLRAIVVGGLAGAAWLLTGAAAYAAESDAEPISGSAFGIVLDDDVEPATDWFTTNQDPVVDELLKAAVQPLESVPKTHHHVLTMLLDPADEPAEEDRSRDDEPTIEAEPSGDALRTALAPLRSSSGDADDPEQHAAGEGEAADLEAEPVAQAPDSTATGTLPSAAELLEHPAVTGPAEVVAAPAPVRVVASGNTRASRAPATGATDGAAPARRAKVHSRSHVNRHAPAARPVAPEAIREETPGGDGPAPARTNLGAVSGIPAGSGSGSNPEGGSSAVLPSGIANGPVACHRCPVAPDVDARRHDAEAPTVSPD